MGRGKEGWKGRLEKRGIVGLRCQGRNREREELARKSTFEHRGERGIDWRDCMLYMNSTLDH